MNVLAQQQCPQQVDVLGKDEVQRFISDLHSDWSLSADKKSIVRTFTFSNYYQTLAFINSVAQIAHKQDHHPDTCFGYKQCEITYSTHSVGGLSLNDFICAAKIDLIESL